MARVTFYTHVADTTDFIYRFCKKMFSQRQKLWIYGDDAQILWWDRQLWTHKDADFLAHEILPQDQVIAAPIVLANVLPNTQAAVFNVWLNLVQAPLIDGQAVRVIEVVSQEADALVIARHKYRHYQQAGYQIEHHKMG